MLAKFTTLFIDKTAELGLSLFVDQQEAAAEATAAEYMLKTRIVGAPKYYRFIRRLKKGDILQLGPDFNHENFVNLIALLNDRQQTVGHLPSSDATALRPEIESGNKYYAKVLEMNGEERVEVGVYKVH